MAESSVIIDGDAKYLQVEHKEDSAEMLAYMQGKPSNNFLTSEEFETKIRPFLNLLRDDVDSLVPTNSYYAKFDIEPSQIQNVVVFKNTIGTSTLVRTGVGEYKFSHLGLNSTNKVSFKLVLSNSTFRVLYFFSGANDIDFVVINPDTNEPVDTTLQECQIFIDKYPAS